MNLNQKDQLIEHFKQLYLQEQQKNQLLIQNNEQIKSDLNLIRQNNQILQKQINSNNKANIYRSLKYAPW